MIDLYFRPTSNGHKITILLEEAGLPYRLIPMHTVEGGHFGPTFLRVSPNNKMPAIVDHAPADGGGPINVFESGAILIYLAEKCGRFLPSDSRGRADVLQWLMWQMAGLGPVSGQNGHFRHQALADVGGYTQDRFARELGRLYTVLDYRLRGRETICAGYSIADIACHPWIGTFALQGMDLDAYPDLNRWWLAIGERPALKRAYGAEHYAPSPRPATDAEHEQRFRQTGAMLRDAYARMEQAGP